MSRLSAIRRSLRSAALATLDRIRRVLPGPFGRSRDARGVGSVPGEVTADPHGSDRGDGGAVTRQSTLGSSSTALEDPARFDDPGTYDLATGDGDADALGRRESGGDVDRVATGTEPLDGLPVRDRSLTEPAEEGANDTRTEGERRPGGRFRIADPENPDAYVVGDVSVALDHVR